MAQPITTQPMSNQMNPGMIQVNPGTREWSTGMFDCFSDVKSMMYAWLCFPCFMGGVSTRLGEDCCVGCSQPVALRTKMRTLLGIQGSINKDAWAMCLCAQCTGCQMARELDAANL